MFKNRLTVIITVLAVLVVSLAISRPLSMAGVSKAEGTNDFYQRHPEWNRDVQGAILPITGRDELSDYYQLHPERNWEETRPYIMDSATRSYIAWGEALEAADKLHGSQACSNSNQENVFERIDPTLDSATRSYIAWGLALQATDNIQVCR